MKTLSLTVILLSTQMAFAGGAKERVILQDSKTITTEVSNETVRCSEVGYGLSELKINLSGLDGWTLLDHSNIRFGELAGEPCMTAGACKMDFNPNGPGFSIEDLIQNRPGRETITVQRRVSEIKIEDSRDTQTGIRETCLRSIREELKTTVRGIEFNHSRTSETMERLPIAACRR